MRKKPLLATPLALLALAASAFCQTLPPGVQKKASAGGITEYDFPNGLRVLLYPDAANPKVTVNVTYLVGSRHEGYGETGMAHLLEHMDFIETTNGRHIKNEIVNRGAAWNGTTSFDRTNYYETVPANDENLKWALALEADRACGSDGLPLAQLRQIDHRLERRYREGAGGTPGGLLQEVLSARQCRARHHRPAG
jgi:zinc protease